MKKGKIRKGKKRGAKEALEAYLVALFKEIKLCVIHTNCPRAFRCLGGST